MPSISRLSIPLLLLIASVLQAADLKVMRTGLGTGRIASVAAGIDCGADCDQGYAGPDTVRLNATAPSGSVFRRWEGDCAGTAPACTLVMASDRSVRAEFAPADSIRPISRFEPESLAVYLDSNPLVTTPGRFVKALPRPFKQNWILMSRSESLQPGTADLPRILLPSRDMKAVFTFGLAPHAAYPGAHPNAIEYMQWDAADSNFRFHEIVVDTIPPMGLFPARSRGVSIDDARCSRCHSTRNVLNRGAFPGTTGKTPGVVKAKNKPNWDTYDSWGGMLPFNRDRIYRGSVEAAAFRRLFNPWTFRGRDTIRAVMEQLELQPPGVPAGDTISRVSGGAFDGHVRFAFDSGRVVTREPPLDRTDSIRIAYSFNDSAGTPPGTFVRRDGLFVRLHHSDSPGNDEGRGVQFFDILGGADGSLNQLRIADEIIRHRFATGSVPIDVRPITLAIAKGCVSQDAAADSVRGAGLAINRAFFDARNGMRINALMAETRGRIRSLPRRKADIQKINLDRTGDPYLDTGTAGIGLIQRYGDSTAAGADTSKARVRQEVFRRSTTGFGADSTVMGRVYVDREDYAYNPPRIGLYRYFLEPLGVAVDKWSMGVRGRSRTYTFADVFDDPPYDSIFNTHIPNSLRGPDSIPGLRAPFACPDLIRAVNTTLGALPDSDDVPPYTDVQRIFNKSCIECHGGLGYPPFARFYDANYLDLSEKENGASCPIPVLETGDRFTCPHAYARGFTNTDTATSYLYQRITRGGEHCPDGVLPIMPCGGPPLPKTDILTIARWIRGGRPSTEGDPHLVTVDGTAYDFQAAGEFTLLRGEDLEIQVRQAPVETEGPLGPNPHTGLTSCVSINTAAAVRVGPHRIAYQPDPGGEPDPEGLQLWLDGKRIGRKIGRGGIPLDAGGRILPTSAPGGIQIEYPGGTDIVITPGWWDRYRIWFLNVNVRHARAVEGLMGTIVPRQWLPALPDGRLLGPRPAALPRRYADLYDVFGDAWRVTDRNSLFTYAPGKSTADYTVKAWPGENPQSCRIPGDPDAPQGPGPAKPLPAEEAARLCSGLTDAVRRANCEADVRITGEPAFANTYLMTEKIQLNRIPPPPILVSPEPDAKETPTGARFVWNRTADADGGTLTYRHCVWEPGRALTFKNCSEVDLAPAWRLPALVLLVIVAVVFLGLLITASRGRARWATALLLILAAVAYLYRPPSGDRLTATVRGLEPGRTYFWKVLAEDGQSGTVESETRRFTTAAK